MIWRLLTSNTLCGVTAKSRGAPSWSQGLSQQSDAVYKLDLSSSTVPCHGLSKAQRTGQIQVKASKFQFHLRNFVSLLLVLNSCTTGTITLPWLICKILWRLIIYALVEWSFVFLAEILISVFLLNPRVPAEMHACANIQILIEDDNIISFLSSYKTIR